MNREIPGKYINKKNRSHFVELKADGRCLLFEGAPGVVGRYEVHGDEVTIFAAESSSTAKIQNGVITDSEGDAWIRRSPDDDPLESIEWLPPILKRPDFPWELVEAAGLVVVLIGLLFVAFTQKP
jgi:hypothetical protein